MIKMIGRFAFVLAVVAAVALPAQANSKYKKYMQQSLGDLLLSCVEGDVINGAKIGHSSGGNCSAVSV